MNSKSKRSRSSNQFQSNQTVLSPNSVQLPPLNISPNTAIAKLNKSMEKPLSVTPCNAVAKLNRSMDKPPTVVDHFRIHKTFDVAPRKYTKAKTVRKLPMPAKRPPLGDITNKQSSPRLLGEDIFNTLQGKSLIQTKRKDFIAAIKKATALKWAIGHQRAPKLQTIYSVLESCSPSPAKKCHTDR